MPWVRRLCAAAIVLLLVLPSLGCVGGHDREEEYEGLLGGSPIQRLSHEHEPRDIAP